MPLSEVAKESKEFLETRQIHQASNAEAVYLGVKLQRLCDKIDTLITLLTPKEKS